MELTRLPAIFIGTYTSPGGSEGIYQALLDIQTGELTQKKLFAKLQNIIALVIKPGRFIFFNLLFHLFGVTILLPFLE
jgi:6-phosphogluconolactonase (cycloisomerase 2 family)